MPATSHIGRENGASQGADAFAGRIGNYHYAGPHVLREREAGGVRYIVGIASAYNAFGLIDPERSGVFVLDETNKHVVLDQHARAPSGFYGPTQDQLAEFEAVLAMGDAEFSRFVRENPRTRPQYRSLGLKAA